MCNFQMNLPSCSLYITSFTLIVLVPKYNYCRLELPDKALKPAIGKFYLS